MLEQLDPNSSENQLNYCEVRNVDDDDDDDDDNNNNNKCSACRCTTCLFPLSLSVHISGFEVSESAAAGPKIFFCLLQNAGTVNQLLCPRAGGTCLSL